MRKTQNNNKVKTTNKMVKKQGYVEPSTLYEKLIPKLIHERAYYDSSGKILDIDKVISQQFKYIQNKDLIYGRFINDNDINENDSNKG